VSAVSEAAGLAPALASAGGQAVTSGLPAFVVVHTERKANVALHSEIDAAVRQALAELPAGP
jgi:hypothetical protein